MGRYIDAELLDPEEFENCTPYQANEIIANIPTADVVPKSEVYKIFEEIEEYVEDMGFSSFRERWEFNDFLAELKKKYVEE